jgi:hypothetical protein
MPNQEDLEAIRLRRQQEHDVIDTVRNGLMLSDHRQPRFYP